MSAQSLVDTLPTLDTESGYASGDSNDEHNLNLFFTKSHLKYLNSRLSALEPEEIIQWCLISLPHLYQTTAFGLTGLVTIDMISKLSEKSATRPKVDLIFLDTLYHFSETLELVEKVKRRYPLVQLHIYKPDGMDTAAEFEDQYGQQLWDINEDLYDWTVKVEPAQRAYRELQVKAVLTGRRRSQGGKRGDIDIIEVDDAGLIKVNPLANWSFKQVHAYISENNVPSNELLNRGYKSVGDWHSTQPIADGQDERSGRWSGRAKTECGIHNQRSRYAQFLEERQLQPQAALSNALERIEIKAGG